MTIEIYRAADTFLYLPTYVAEEFKILDTLFDKVSEQYPSISVEFMPINSNFPGDSGAFNQMYSANNNKSDTIAIAVCSPSILLSNEIEFEQAKDCTVIAAIIDKLPFWGINHNQQEFKSIDELTKHYKSVIYPNDNYKEGFYLGKKLRHKINIGHPVNFGDEIDTLETRYKKKEEPIAISADVVNIVKSTNRFKNPLRINYRFSKDEQYLTTGLITTKNAGEKHPKILSLLIEGIQKSISMIYSSNMIAQEICQKISTKYYNKIVLSDVEIEKIVELINKEEFYPADLNISKESWVKAITNLGKVEVWDESKMDENFINNTFDEFVSNKYVLESEQSLARQYGIDLSTFGDEINEKLVPIQDELNSISAKIKGIPNGILLIFRNLFSFGKVLISLAIKYKLILLVIGIITIFWVVYKYYLKESLTTKDVYITCITIVVTFLPSIISFSKKQK